MGERLKPAHFCLVLKIIKKKKETTTTIIICIISSSLFICSVEKGGLRAAHLSLMFEGKRPKHETFDVYSDTKCQTEFYMSF